MSNADSQAMISAEEAFRLVELAEKAAMAQNIPELAETFLESLIILMDLAAAVLFLGDNRSVDSFFQVGLPATTMPAVKKLCTARFEELSVHPNLPPERISLEPPKDTWLTFFPIQHNKDYLGLLGLVMDKHELATEAVLWKKTLPFFTHGLKNLVDRLEYERQITNLNTYLNVSSMITQALDLGEVLEAVLYFCMEAVSAEASSVLLLDYEKKNFRFYSVEGPAKPVLLNTTFPADQGLAGSVLTSQQSEVINDVRADPRFYGKIDADSGFQTRNMIVIPLTAGEEKIGVLEVLNKIDGGPFLEEEYFLLQSIAEEIAFAIRNAKLFEVVVKSYCKQRQGLNTCRGCKRPLRSWTPCVKYREEEATLTG
jgi:hypothetical protein